MNLRTLLPVLVPGLLCSALAAQSPCLQWSEGLGYPGRGFGGSNKSVSALATFDSGSGPRLYAGGSFSQADGVPCRRVAFWDGTRWQQAGAGLGSADPETDGVGDLVVFDDGSGPALYASGMLHGATPGAVWRWDGSQWTVVPGAPTYIVYDLEVFDDGSGPALYTAGFGYGAETVRRWDGVSWTTLSGAYDTNCIKGFDDGTGPKLYVGVSGGGSQANGTSLKRWTGSGWTPIGALGGGSVLDMKIHDDGSGPRLFVAGAIFTCQGQPAGNIVAWDGTNWDTLQGGVGSTVYSLFSHDFGTGPALYVGGYFTSAGGQPASNLARWSGGQWSAPGGGVDAHVFSMAAQDTGAGERLIAGGLFTSAAGHPAPEIAAFDGSTWDGFAPALGVAGRVLAFHPSSLGNGPELWVGGEYAQAGSTLARNLARFDGAQWTDVGGANAAVQSFATYDSGSGPELYAGGKFTQLAGVNASRIARWNGVQWSALGSGIQFAGNPALAEVDALAVFDAGSGSQLYVGGSFTAAGPVGSFHLARWNGTSWSDVGANNRVRALRVFDDGSGPALYAGGDFTQIGGVLAEHVARMQGGVWSALGNGLSGDFVGCFASFDGGSGARLFAGGSFQQSGGTILANLARWDGLGWSAIPGATLLGGPVSALTVWDDGSTAALYCGGAFTLAAGAPADNLARWDGHAWSSLGSGTDGPVGALASMATQGGARDLYVGGSFHLAGDRVSAGIARWEGCGNSSERFCFGDGTGLVSCPCANHGSSEHGCENSAGTGGALLSANGTTNPDTLVLGAQGELPSALTIFLQGDLEIAPVAFGDGLRCTGGHLKRLYAHNASSGLASAPLAGELAITQRSAQLGDAFASGATRLYQAYYRDANASFCAAPSGNTWNVTNAVRVDW